MKLNKKYLTVTIDEKALVKQAVEANLEEWKNRVKDRRQFRKYRDHHVESGNTKNAEYWTDREAQALAEFVTIQETIERIFPDHEDLIGELFYAHYN